MKTKLRIIAIAIAAALVSSCSQYQLISVQDEEPAAFRNSSGFPSSSPPIPLAETVRL